MGRVGEERRQQQVVLITIMTMRTGGKSTRRRSVGRYGWVLLPPSRPSTSRVSIEAWAALVHATPFSVMLLLLLSELLLSVNLLAVVLLLVTASVMLPDTASCKHTLSSLREEL